MYRTLLIVLGVALAGCDPTSDNPPADTSVADLSGDVSSDVSVDTAADSTAGGGPDSSAPDAATFDATVDSLPGTDAVSDLGVVPDAPDVAISPVACAEALERVVTFQTDDGQTLAADFHPTGTANGPAVVLFHMIPPGNDRTNYPADFRSLLVSRGIAVLNVDRRGAGASSGKAIDAYQGPNGKLDVKAAMAFLATAPCPIDMNRVGLIGASNGTTSVLDYTVYAATDPTSPAPAALVFLTGGTYTENQNSINANLELLSPLPLLFVYASNEATWSKAFELIGSMAWRFEQYTPGGHGTQMFGIQPKSPAMVVDWLVGRL
ncbi:MAG: hypothetical protein R3F39_19420 [Myxococcota bacterium]